MQLQTLPVFFAIFMRRAVFGSPEANRMVFAAWDAAASRNSDHRGKSGTKVSPVGYLV
jgi:hypothetical protein